MSVNVHENVYTSGYIKKQQKNRNPKVVDKMDEVWAKIAIDLRQNKINLKKTGPEYIIQYNIMYGKRRNYFLIHFIGYEEYSRIYKIDIL